MASVLERDLLRRNDSSMANLNLLLQSDSNIVQTTKSLLIHSIDYGTRDSRVSDVTVTIHDSFIERRWRHSEHENDRQDIEDFFQAIGSLPNLKSLSFYAGSYGNPPEMPVPLIVEALRGSRKRLQRLKIHGVSMFLGNSTSRIAINLSDLVETLRHHPALQEVSIVRSFFGMAEGEDERQEEYYIRTGILGMAYEGLFQACSTIQNLECLGVHHRRTGNFVSVLNNPLNPSTLCQFRNLQRLRQLEVFNFKIEEEHLEQFAMEFEPENNGHDGGMGFPNLQELSLSCTSFGKQACIAIAKIINSANKQTNKQTSSWWIAQYVFGMPRMSEFKYRMLSDSCHCIGRKLSS